MAHESHEPPISEYERAVCYYSLPRVLTPVTAGLIAAYAICFVEAVAALSYGVWKNDPVWTKWGTIAVAGAVALGLGVFFYRAFQNEVRKKRLLQSAHSVPDPTSGFDDLPDPFESHELLRFPVGPAVYPRTLEDNSGSARYVVESVNAHTRSVRLADSDSEVFHLKLSGHGVSFSLDSGAAVSVQVQVDGETVATIREKFGLMGNQHVIRSTATGDEDYLVRNGTVRKGNEVVGRVYELRHFAYLDVDSSHVNPAILAYFILFV